MTFASERFSKSDFDRGATKYERISLFSTRFYISGNIWKGTGSRSSGMLSLHVVIPQPSSQPQVLPRCTATPKHDITLIWPKGTYH